MSLEALLLHREIEDFLFAEAALMDERRFDEWLELLTEDVRVFMPISRNVRYDQKDREQTREEQEMAWFDEGKDTLTLRARQIATGLHWAEEPRSRTVHMLTNIRITGTAEDAEGQQEVTVQSAFHLYRNRGQDETDHMIGRRTDVVVRTAAGWRLRHRRLDLAQSVLLAKNLTTFF